MATDADFRDCLGCTCFASRRAARAITQHYERLMKRSGLRVTQFTLLAVLVLSGPQPLSRLADLLGVERTTLTRNLRLLLERGWVTESAAGDRRVRMLAITKRGTATAKVALPHWREAQKTMARKLGADTIQALAAAADATSRLQIGRV